MGVKKMGFILGFLGFLFFEGLMLCSAAEVRQTIILKEMEEMPLRLCSTEPKNIFTVDDDGKPSWPGPTITVHKGDKAYITVQNDGEYGVTIHWHGVKQPRNPWYDGPEYITQMPIEPKKNLTYEVIFSDEEGTLWWHAHSDWSRATIHGAIVILPAAQGTTYPFPEPHAQQVLILGEWYKGDVKEIIDNAMKDGGDPILSDAYAINGLLGPSDACPTDEPFRLPVEKGKTYLLRIVNAVMNEEMFFGIAQHKLTLVGQDGAYTKQFSTDYIMISPGQTMDVLLAADQEASQYYMKASPYAGGDPPYDKSYTLAILEYKDYTPPNPIPSPSLPDAKDGEKADDFTSKIKALGSKEHPVNVPRNINKRILITVSVDEIFCAKDDNCGNQDGNRHSASLNSISFKTPSTDILHSYYCKLPLDKDFPDMPPIAFNYTGDAAANNIAYQYPTVGTKALMIKYGEEVEIVFQGTNVGGAENHPMHLHGYSFYLVGTGYGNWVDNSTVKYNMDDPPEINTVGVPKNGWAVIRFKADNPGVWFMHCHLERHASWGMDTVLIVENGSGGGEDESIRQMPTGFPPCPTN